MVKPAKKLRRFRHLTTDSAGKFSFTWNFPCPGTFEVVAWRFDNNELIGLFGGGGAASCQLPPTDTEANLLMPRGDSRNAQDAGPTDSKTSVGCPVNVTNGNVWFNQADYSLPGVGENIAVSRWYNSMASTATNEAGMFGRGWMSSLDEWLKFFESGAIVRLRLSSGQKNLFFVSKTTGSSDYDVVTPGFYGSLIKNGDNTYTLTFLDGRIHHFSSVGVLQWLKDRDGNQTTFTYNGNFDLTEITEPLGRKLFVTTAPPITPTRTGRVITQIRDSLGVIANYTYNGKQHASIRNIRRWLNVSV